jgi:hypothetical protein
VPIDASAHSLSSDASNDADKGTLSQALARSAAEMLAPTAPVELAQSLEAGVVDVSDYEASARGSASGSLRAGRMMIERAAPELFPAIAKALDVDLPATADRWIDLALRERVPLIAGWDLRGGSDARCVKLYVNASDAGHDARSRLCEALAPDISADEHPPAVLGMNARADGLTEAKLYIQSADAVELAAAHGKRARVLAEAAHSEQADAGGVLSLDVDEAGLSPRAFFVALREPAPQHTWQCVTALPGYDSGAIKRLLPFPPAPPRSVGISLGDDSWTLYFKPVATMRAPQALEPTAIFRADKTEVGVFVEPTEHAARAFRRTDRHAVSIRIREGEPTPRSLEDLVEWFTHRLRLSEKDGSNLDSRLCDPPAPWRTVDKQLAAGNRGGSA